MLRQESVVRLPSLGPIADLVLQARRKAKAAIKQASAERRKALVLRVEALDAAHAALKKGCPKGSRYTA